MGIWHTLSMDTSTREWWIKVKEKEEGPLTEDAFQDRLRAGKIPLSAMIKSSYMEKWEPLLSVVANDQTFRRPSTMPATHPADDTE